MRRIATRNCLATPLGLVATCSQSLKTETALLLRSRMPIVSLWGEGDDMIYSGAYSVSADGRYPGLLGSKVREGWPRVTGFNGNVAEVGLAGGTLGCRDQELPLYRHGRPEQMWMNFNYSLAHDESSQPAGVPAIVFGTTTG